MAEALGVADRDAMHGILKQLVKASANGQKPDAGNLGFMISTIKSIKPRDAVEAMLVAQMVSVHVMAMRCAYHLANADDIARHDSAARALGRLARTFPAQIEALNRHRNHAEPAITVQNVRIADGGNAIVGNVTQHRSVIVSDNSGAAAATDARMRAMPDRGAREHDFRGRGGRSAGVNDHAADGSDAAASCVAARAAQRRIVPRAGGARQTTLPYLRRARWNQARKGKPETRELARTFLRGKR